MGAEQPQRFVRSVEQEGGGRVDYVFEVQDVDAGRFGWRREVHSPTGELLNRQVARHRDVKAELPDAGAKAWADHVMRIPLHTLGEHMAKIDEQVESDPDSDVEALLAQKDNLAALIQTVTRELHAT